ncbi:helix-turn-helix domain-containing protein [Turicibacter sanguinis]|uniref:Helix-turn-helix domain-containing protein n=1 Tax=Turicibacter sanguinis TaxID=154288 RepID=A0A6G2CD87_9FIRM|nr:helix-turn-helix transcriptional regulator [Turicibacter sanguinis]MDB8564557.1 helix-turn-helix transcriptional regulator [Turicibacter sanguinis]MTK70500.1 helix-turn-helix domain-containing protein [Turicibacter sanguinis]MTK81318.1 helix-turn-helix domain-containing protein [Turicibacter sanguinis]MTK83656.1 helix-turn-helix domain-containing protein [Turicibacter sanguinis]MTK86382.1 helix-turn-helix domain-containing protein [Turicibacter sanguinis]
MLGNRLKSLRRGANLTQKQLADKLNISPSTIAMYEGGKRDPDTDTLKKLSNVLSVSVDYLTGNDSPKTKKEHLTTINDAVNTHLGEDISIMFKDITDWDEEKIKKLKTFIELIDEGKI